MKLSNTTVTRTYTTGRDSYNSLNMLIFSSLLFCLVGDNTIWVEMKYKKSTKYHTAETAPNSNRKIIRRCLLNNYCLYVRWTSRIVNTLWMLTMQMSVNYYGCSPHTKAITFVLFRTVSIFFLVDYRIMNTPLVSSNLTVTVNCRAAIQPLFIYVYLCLSVKLDIRVRVHLHSYPFISLNFICVNFKF